jgi:hypothetical protein
MKPKKTALEWFAEVVNSAKWKWADVTDRNAIIEQAKEMERQERQESYANGYANGQRDAYTN